MKRVTVWERYDWDEKRWMHNHIEEGHLSGEPVPVSDEQRKSWKGALWRATHALLEDGVVRDA